MKFNVTVDIDWINEDSTLDETVSEQIKTELTNKVFSAIEAQVKGKLTEKISSKIDEIFDEKIMQTYDEFLSKGFNIYDKWGDLKEENVNVKEILKKKLDTFMTETVDGNGRASAYSDNPRYRKILDDQAQRQINSFLSEVSSQVVEGIKKDINDETAKRISESILKDYDLKKLIHPMA